MAERWLPVPLEAPMFANVNEAALRRSPVVLENAYINDANGHTRFPGLRLWKQLPTSGNVYLGPEWHGDMVAATSTGRVFRIDKNRNAVDVTGVPPAGGGRVIFAKSEDQLLMAAGGPIVQLGDGQTEILSDTAPHASHVAYLAGFIIANDVGSQRWFFADDFRNWRPIDVFTAEFGPDNITSLLVTPFGELMLAGLDTIEQYEPYPGGDRPFFRRWSVGEGIIAPYSLCFTDSAAWGVNGLSEFVRFSAQQSKPESRHLAMTFEKITSWLDAFTIVLPTFGQRFIVLTLPHAENPYGTEGLSFGLDYVGKRWMLLYGWDDVRKVPARWPAESCEKIWQTTYIGGQQGRIYTLDDTYFANDGVTQRMFYRTGGYDGLGKSRIDNLRTRMRRGAPENMQRDPAFQIRYRRDTGPWGKWQSKGLGMQGDKLPMLYWGQQGTGHVHQWEYRITEDAPVELVSMEILATRVD